MDINRQISLGIKEVGGDIVVAGYLFGSTLKRHEFKGDLDIGLLIEEDALKDGTVKIQSRIYLGLRDSLNREDIDVVILNIAPPLLRYGVIKEGGL